MSALYGYITHPRACPSLRTRRDAGGGGGTMAAVRPSLVELAAPKRGGRPVGGFGTAGADGLGPRQAVRARPPPCVMQGYL